MKLCDVHIKVKFKDGNTGNFPIRNYRNEGTALERAVKLVCSKWEGKYQEAWIYDHSDKLRAGFVNGKKVV